MRNLFGRVGSKTTMVKHIVPLIPEHKIYVEPFVGGGAIYFHKNPSEEEIVNDIDDELMEGYRLVSQVSSDINDYTHFNTYEHKKQFYNNDPISNENKLLHKILKSCCTFGSIGKSSLYIDRNQMPKIKNIDKYIKKE